MSIKDHFISISQKFSGLGLFIDTASDFNFRKTAESVGLLQNLMTDLRPNRLRVFSFFTVRNYYSDSTNKYQ